jgi:hypothetical protein
MKAIVSVVVTRHQISLPKDLLQTSLYLGCFYRLQYSRISPVSPSSTADAKLQRHWRGNLHDAACWLVKGCVRVDTSIMWNRKSSVIVLPLRWWHVLAEGGMTDS